MPSNYKTIFFDAFGQVQYDFGTPGVRGEYVTMTDFTKYVNVEEEESGNIPFYVYYDILDGERPDQVSYALYNNPKYYWTFFLINDHLKTGLSGWPLGQNEMDNYIQREYGNKMFITGNTANSHRELNYIMYTNDDGEFLPGYGLDYVHTTSQGAEYTLNVLGQIPILDEYNEYASITSEGLNWQPTDVNIVSYHHDRHSLITTYPALENKNQVLQSFNLGDNPPQKTKDDVILAIRFDFPDVDTKTEFENSLPVKTRNSENLFNDEVYGDRILWFSKAEPLDAVASPEDAGETTLIFPFSVNNKYSTEYLENAIYEFYDVDDEIISYYDTLKNLVDEARKKGFETFSERDRRINEEKKRIRIPRPQIIDKLYNNYLNLISQ